MLAVGPAWWRRHVKVLAYKAVPVTQAHEEGTFYPEIKYSACLGFALHFAVVLCLRP